MMLNSVFVLDAAGGSPVLPDISGMLSSLCKAGKRVSLSQLAAGLAGSLAAVVLFG
jgi:hypothetical protein